VSGSKQTVAVYPCNQEMEKYALFVFDRISSAIGIERIRRIGHNYEFEQGSGSFHASYQQVPRVEVEGSVAIAQTFGANLLCDRGSFSTGVYSFSKPHPCSGTDISRQVVSGPVFIRTP
jgi:hypothetical protein